LALLSVYYRAKDTENYKQKKTKIASHDAGIVGALRLVDKNEAKATSSSRNDVGKVA
jgi:hypothetical protein